MSLTYDDLFAFRISYLDTIDDETIIIKELKKQLYRSGLTNIDEINDFLVNFYKNYNIEISKEVISQVEFDNNLSNNFSSNIFTNNSLPSNIFQMLGQLSSININSQNQNNDSDDSDDSELDSDEDYSDMPELESIEEVNNEVSNSDNNSSNNSLNTLPPLQLSINLNNGNIIFPPGIINSHTFTNNLNQPNNSPNGNFMQGFNAFMTAVNNVNNTNNMEPVRVTISDNDEKKIKYFKSDKDLDFNCTVCMGKLCKNEELAELPCKHTFHKDCVMEWLKEYSYLCPVCREECGEGKKNF